MRQRIAFDRAKKSDQEALSCLARHYKHLGDLETIAEALPDSDSLSALVAHVRHLAAHRKHPDEALATAVVSPEELRLLSARCLGLPSAVRADVRLKASAAGPTQEPVETAEEPVETKEPGTLEKAQVEPHEPLVEPLEVEEVEEPAHGRDCPFGCPGPKAVEPPPSALISSPGLTPGAFVEPPKPPSTPTPTRRAKAPKANAGTATLTPTVTEKALGAVLASTPLRWLWPDFDCIRFSISPGSLAIFGRGESLATWFTLKAETQGSACVRVPRSGAVALKALDGTGPCTVRIFADRVTAEREGGSPLLLPAQPDTWKPCPEWQAKGGVIVSRRDLRLLLEVPRGQELPEEVRLVAEAGRLLVGDVAIPASYSAGVPWEARLDPRFLRVAAARGTGAECLIETFGDRQPIRLEVGALTSLIARRVADED